MNIRRDGLATLLSGKSRFHFAQLIGTAEAVPSHVIIPPTH